MVVPPLRRATPTPTRSRARLHRAPATRASRLPDAGRGERLPVDLATGAPRPASRNMKPGQYALFPHFRSRRLDLLPGPRHRRAGRRRRDRAHRRERRRAAARVAERARSASEAMQGSGLCRLWSARASPSDRVASRPGLVLRADLASIARARSHRSTPRSGSRGRVGAGTTPGRGEQRSDGARGLHRPSLGAMPYTLLELAERRDVGGLRRAQPDEPRGERAAVRGVELVDGGHLVADREEPRVARFAISAAM